MMAAVPGSARRPGTAAAAGAQPLSPRVKWRAITIATLAFLPAYWAVLIAMVASAGDRGPSPGPAFALGLSLIPFVFLALAFFSGHPSAPGAVLRAMGLAIIVGIPVSALAADALTGLVAGMGAGGISALRKDGPGRTRARAAAVAIAAAYTFILLRMVPEITILLAPTFPFTSLGIADHLADRRTKRQAA